MTEAQTPTTPRRWNTEVDGIKWIPRMADKARMRGAGTLGSYLMGHSPVDASLLRVLGMKTDEWVALVAKTSTDDEVLTALRARGIDEAKLRAWSAKFETRFKVYIPLWDLDEGYLAPSAGQRVGLTLFKPIEGLAMGLVRLLRPAP